MILNDNEANEYLRLKAIFNADAELKRFEEKLDYLYNTQLIPVHEREDIKRYPEVRKMSVEEMERRLKCSMESLLDILSKLRGTLKLHRTTIPTDI